MSPTRQGPSARQGRPTRPVSPTRQVWHVVLARLVSSAGAEAAFFIGLWGRAAYEFEGGPTELAIMSGVVGTSAIIGATAGGALVDRFDARRVVIGAEVAFVPATLGLILAGNLTQLLAIGTVVWLAGAVLETAITSLPPVLVADDQLDRANARLESANWLAFVIGPAMGGLLFPLIGFSGTFVLDAVSSLVALALVWQVRIPEAADAEAGAGGGGGFADVVDGLRFAFGHPRVRLVLVLTVVVGMAFGMFVALEPLFFRDVVGAPVETLGYVNSVFGAGLFAGSLIVERARGRLTTFRAAVLVTFLAGLGSLPYVATGDLRWVLVGAVTWSIPFGMSLPITRTLAQRAAPRRYVGRVTGAIGSAGNAAGLLPVVFAPALAGAVGVQAVLMGASGLAALVGPLLWRTATRLDASPADPSVAEQADPSVAEQADPSVAEQADPSVAAALEAGEAAPQQAGE